MALREELDVVLEESLATDDEEQARNLYAIAGAVRDQTREVIAAVEVAVPSRSISLEELRDALGPHVISTADRISARLGYRRADESRG